MVTQIYQLYPKYFIFESKRGSNEPHESALNPARNVQWTPRVAKTFTSVCFLSIFFVTP